MGETDGALDKSLKNLLVSYFWYSLTGISKSKDNKDYWSSRTSSTQTHSKEFFSESYSWTIALWVYSTLLVKFLTNTMDNKPAKHKFFLLYIRIKKVWIQILGHLKVPIALDQLLFLLFMDNYKTTFPRNIVFHRAFIPITAFSYPTMNHSKYPHSTNEIDCRMFPVVQNWNYHNNMYQILASMYLTT